MLLGWLLELTVWRISRDIDEDEIEKHLEMTVRGSPPLDVLIRTSGTYRLSDYMLWQVGDSGDLRVHSLS